MEQCDEKEKAQITINHLQNNNSQKSRRRTSGRKRERKKTMNEVRSYGVNTYIDRLSVPAVACWFKKRGDPESEICAGIKS